MAADDRGPVRQPRPEWATLEVIIARLAATGRLPMLNLVKSEDRFQASLQNADRKAFRVSVQRTAVDAVIDVLGPHAFQSWEDHLGITSADGYDPTTQPFDEPNRHVDPDDEDDDGMHLI